MPTYAQVVNRERKRRTQLAYEKQARKQVGKEFGDRPDYTRQAVRTGRQFAAPEFRNYQAIILVEFIAAELLVSATPMASRQHKTGLSPYVPRDMIKLLSLGLLYFLLELLAVGGRGPGRFGAWFGGLVLLGVGLNEGANVAKTLDLFGGVQGSQSPLQKSVQAGRITIT